MLVAALAPWPYGYYTLLRWVVCLSACFVAWVWYDAYEQPTPMVWAFGAVAILFNPLAPIHLNREIWSMIDLATAAFLIWGTILSPFRNTATEPENGSDNHKTRGLTTEEVGEQIRQEKRARAEKRARFLREIR